jgi:predicted tellurium resistance membrane protein TerC
VPLAFGFTKPPYIVLASCTFALLGVRSMYAFVYAIHMDVAQLKVSLAIALWLVAVDLIISPHLAKPSWLVPIIVLIVVAYPMVTGFRNTAKEERDRRAHEAIGVGSS